jgi:hypothetical protein
MGGTSLMSSNVALLSGAAGGAVLALILLALTGRKWLSALIGGLVPGLIIFAYYLYLEGQQPVGPYYALFGIGYAAIALPFGLLFALLAVHLRELWTEKDDG